MYGNYNDHYIYTYRPTTHPGLSGIFDTIWNVTKAVVNTVVPYGGAITAGAELLVDAIVPDSGDNKPKGIGSMVVTAEGATQETVSDTLEDRVSIPDFLSWPYLATGKQQVDNQQAHKYSFSALGYVTRVESILRSHVITKVRQYFASRGREIWPIFWYGHLCTIRNPAGGKIPIGMTTPQGAWVSFDQRFAVGLTMDIEAFRRLLEYGGEQARAAQPELGERASYIVSVEEPEGKLVPPAPKKTAGLPDWVIIGAIGAGAYFLFIRKGKRKGKKSKVPRI